MTNEPCSNWAILMSFDSASAQRQDRAYVLHARAYKNTSLIVDMFSRDHGRMTLVAKGARRAGSPFYGLLEPFTSLFIAWGGRSEMKTLYKAESVAGNDKLSGELIYTGFYLNELIMYLLHKHEAHAALFDAYQVCLEKLRAGQDTELVLRYFELDMLNELGYGVSLDHVLQTGEPVQADQYYEYKLESGLSLAGTADADTLTLSGETLLALAAGKLATEQQKLEAKHLLRSILDYHLDGRPIRARELFAQKKKFPLSR